MRRRALFSLALIAVSGCGASASSDPGAPDTPRDSIVTVSTGDVTLGALCNPVGSGGQTSDGVLVACRAEQDYERARWWPTAR